MPRTPSACTCILSIDHMTQGDGASGRAAASDSIAADVCRQLAAAKLPVTLSLTTAPGSELRQTIKQHGKCEVALLASSWANSGVSRSHISQSLSAGVAMLSTLGCTVTTLAIPGGCLTAHDDVLLRHGLTAVRVAESRLPSAIKGGWWRKQPTSEAASCIRSLRWGLWEVVVNIDLASTGVGGARRAIDRIASQGGAAIIAIDVARLAANAKLLPRLIEHLARRRSENVLIVDTLAGAVARLQTPRHTSARSILHPAAA